MSYPQCKTLPVRKQKCRLLHHGYNAVADESWRKCRLCYITDITLSQWLLGRQPSCAQDFALAPDRRGRKGKKGSNTEGPYIPYDVLQTKREKCAKFGWDRLRNVDLYKVQTNKHEQKNISALYVRLLQHCQTTRTELIYVLYWRACARSVCTAANNSCSHTLTPALFRVFSECDWEYPHVFYLGLESHDVSTKETNKELKSFKEVKNCQFSDVFVL